MKVVNVQVNHLRNPVGIDVRPVRITWNVLECVSQSAFRLTIKERRGKPLFDSGKILSSQMWYSLPKPLPYKTSMELELRAWSEEDEEGVSGKLQLVTGMDVKRKASWTGKWINPEKGKIDLTKRYPASYVKKNFYITELQPGREAYLYATAHGIFDVYINGRRAGRRVLMPGTSQENKRLMVECIPVADLLKKGENEILATIGDGWHRGCMGYSQKRNVFGHDLAFLAQLEIDGEVILATDRTWRASQSGAIRRNDLMAGEEYDATREFIVDWHEVTETDCTYENLVCVDTVPVTEHESFKPRLMTTPLGEQVLDFGQCLVGYVKLDFEGKHGKKLTLHHGEVLDSKGNFTMSNFQNPKARTKQRVDYICKNGRNVYHPTKTYMGFRYVKVEADFEIKPEYFTAVAIYSDMRTTGFFQCGVPEVNRLFENALWSMKGNFVDVPTDCPTREKSGYSGDAQAFVYTAAYLMDCYPVYAKWLREQAATQFEDGVVAQIAPSPNGDKKDTADGGIGWSDSIEIVPFHLMKRYQDDSVIAEHYDTIKRWVDYEIQRAKRTRALNRKILPKEYLPYTIDTGWMWGEWLEPGTNLANYMLKLFLAGDIEVGTAYLYYGCHILTVMAGWLGKPADARYYAAFRDRAREAYRKMCLDDKGQIKEQKRQCRYVRPLSMGLLEGAEKKRAAKRLAGLIHENGNKLNTGFLTTHELCRSLSQNGQTKTAYDLLLQKECPGWLYSVTKGCTTIPENWNCYDSRGNPRDSFNHYSYGAVVGWLFDGVCGIKVNDGKIIIEPLPDERLAYARGIYDSPFGRIVSEWRYEASGIAFHIEIPANMKALIRLPDEEEKAVPAGIYQYFIQKS